MKIQIIALIALVGYLSAKVIDPNTVECSGNKTFTNCGTCENRCSDESPRMCTKECKPRGCYCSGPDFALNQKGDCVLKSDCGGQPSNVTIPNCKNNEVYMTCGPSCKSVCGLRYIWCPAVCGAPGCYCTGEYSSLKEGGECILSSSCPSTKTSTAVPSTQQPSNPTCPENFVFMECGPGCRNNVCEKVQDACPAICRPKGCYCTGDYALDKTTGKCILRSSCPST
uniref:TIL domain-containing protein n=1 Tax=Rhabditophanes sp. KR3021 TaxID=114890 RepID=A0AC35TQM5_9BILA